MPDGRAAIEHADAGRAASGGETHLPTLSVGLPVFNGARLLPDALRSLLGQSFTDFELIVSDNASTDETEAICRDFAARDPRMRYFRQATNIGIHRNHDAVFARARGRYFKWAAHSDLCVDGFFARCVELLEARPDVVIAYPRTRLLLDDVGTVTRDFDAHPDLDIDSPAARAVRFLSHPYFPYFNNPFHGVIRAEALRRTRLNVPVHGSDLVMVLQLAFLGKFVEVPEYLFLRRYTPETDDTAAAEVGLTCNFAEGGGPIDKGLVARARFYAHRFAVTLAAPIGAADKSRVLAYLARELGGIALATGRDAARRVARALR